MRRRRFALDAARRALLAPVQRWGHARKGALVRAIRAGTVSASEVCIAHGISREELDGWIEAQRRGGDLALRTTRRAS